MTDEPGLPLMDTDFDWAWTDELPLGGALAEIQLFIQTYVVLSPEQAVTLALFVAHTHAIAAADTTPYVQATSATKRAGKTRLLEVLDTIVARPWLTGRTSAAALVRKVDAEKPTLLLDESDAAFAGEKDYAEALRGLLNSGYKRSGKSSLCVGKGADIKVKDFSTFSAKVIAGIGKLPDTLADRAIPIVLRRKLSSEPVNRWHDREGRAQGTRLREQLERWVTIGTIDTLRKARPALPEALSDRAQDVWEPLLAIADLAGGDWPARARQAAVALMGTTEDTDAVVELLTDLDILIRDRKPDDALTSKELVESLVEQEDRPWATCGKQGKPLTQHGLANLLAPLGIHSHPRKLAGKTSRTYLVRDFADAIARYLPIRVQPRNRTNESGPESGCTLNIQPPPENSKCNPITPINTGAVTRLHSESRDESDPGETTCCKGGPLQLRCQLCQASPTCSKALR
jgi:Protein of unknown function (DUF3631)